MEFDSQFDAKIRESGNSLVITIPKETIEKLGLKIKDIIEVALKKPKSS